MAKVFLESNHTGVHLALIVSKEEEFQFLMQHLELRTPDIEYDSIQCKMLQYAQQNGLKIDIVCLNTQGIQTFAIRCCAYLMKYAPQYAMLLGTAASRKDGVQKVCYVDSAFNYEEGKKKASVFEHNVKMYESLQCRVWFGDSVSKGCATSGSSVRDDGIPEWSELQQHCRRDLVALDMECSAFFEACNFLRVPCLGSLKGIVDSAQNKTDRDHNEAWFRIANLIKGNVLPNAVNLGFRARGNRLEGETLAVHYFFNFLIYVVRNLAKPLNIIKISQEHLSCMSYEILPITTRRLHLEEHSVSDNHARSWSIWKKGDEMFDIPTFLNLFTQEVDATSNYIKFWGKLSQLISENHLEAMINVVSDDEVDTHQENCKKTC